MRFYSSLGDDLRRCSASTEPRLLDHSQEDDILPRALHPGVAFPATLLLEPKFLVKLPSALVPRKHESNDAMQVAHRNAQSSIHVIASVPYPARWYLGTNVMLKRENRSWENPGIEPERDRRPMTSPATVGCSADLGRQMKRLSKSSCPDLIDFSASLVDMG